MSENFTMLVKLVAGVTVQSIQRHAVTPRYSWAEPNLALKRLLTLDNDFLLIWKVHFGGN